MSAATVPVEMPVFQWPSTVAEIEARVDGVVKDTEVTLNKVIKHHPSLSCLRAPAMQF